MLPFIKSIQLQKYDLENKDKKLFTYLHYFHRQLQEINNFLGLRVFTCILTQILIQVR